MLNTLGMPPQAVALLEEAREAILADATASARALLADTVTQGARYGGYYQSGGYPDGIAHILDQVGMRAVRDDLGIRRADSFEPSSPPGDDDDDGMETCSECGDRWDPDEESHCCGGESCCGYCSDCESHHGDGNEETITVYCHRGADHTYCTECEHTCD